ncbi:hypothetical protein [Agrobacterium rosae]|uniref:Uncharacterized protein n=1 Tax=Agrobacterium rosae TaxID=1972867 RepID=A0A1R3TXW6_9HYPH|nr:hypothetical protein [Agrobacterium rosae]SCX31793.1 hypothetical protein DSM25559_3804 [Agrobacterium rosae]
MPEARPVDPAAGPKAKSRAAARQAVILVHGMGEQIPMDTIKGFVTSLSTSIDEDGQIQTDEIWSKPDPRTGSLELRRLTTRKSKKGGAFANGVRTDFYELYWADLTAGSTVGQLVGWIRYLLFRPWSKVPVSVRPAWLILCVLSFFALALFMLSFIPEACWRAWFPSWFSQSMAIGIAGLLGLGAQQLGTTTFGRVVKYTRADPVNIAARAAVRERGLALLRELHKRQGEDKYDRVIVVGHSLGSILAYDLLNYYWAEREQARAFVEASDAFGKLAAIEDAARALRLGGSDIETKRSAFRVAQADLRRSMSEDAVDEDARWLISDLVTFGSPLTHSEFLLASSQDDLRQRQADRELPTCPPIIEALEEWRVAEAEKLALLPPGYKPQALMAYPNRNPGNTWSLHHAAVFSVVRWTNIFDQSKFVLFGDVISGPLRNAYGIGVRDENLADLDGQSFRFSHTRYWHAKQSAKRQALFRSVVNILDEDS